MIIMGLDPGIAACGYGIIHAKGTKLECLACGVLRTYSDESATKRLESIYQGVSNLISEFSPNTVAVESLFFAKNSKTAMKVGQAKGVLMLAAAHNNLEIFEYTPLQVKQGVCGYGSASKEQVQKMVKQILSLDKIPKPDDAADALAVSLCHSQAYRLRTRL
ncbi:crossover junction endodeoxyribonuclease RuvC [Natranaerobius thermophilus]|uniref:Crossover junction endodeoxyribonuclease RuvC n=1 Tax=Natranaerobius thermophilus (strain ATCC BAA-1301 / DSM 18059 / JW/NM-WN-LF) TaxID=457570 RepID=RUVC_NATTJ|nr:crossover junction endodeoxyribonuclease RuvC [Natranaerobius thermophilus]B2A5L6.1 RecName: Full=Crossover junction endodeoxyribonuclease RuvC; AltName: Full=Holliday junction nuclease RuvC; AltName: Full=Holliday junction resolvase RuvC [Natranaerobius thermophilus JW/NM-WN-LF]ACB85370.1 Holliday junction endonuclease RuvC [Natranaerobius thermophilus JW/NM-WN-LF]